MPIYEYQCDNCDATLEKLQKLGDAPLTDCPECGKSALRKLVSAPSFRLKGGGWYETDFKKDKQKNLHDSAHSEGKSAESESDSGRSKSGESRKSGDAGKSDSSKKSGDAGKPDSSKKSGGNHKTPTSTN
ncbi:MAG: zinc ribbon domain-containing protein [Gammaproteobacteria bacterium]|nr:MAG: zinc ribbon domain-containing protein [Gammaproteobacteria bacterium]